MYEGNPYHNYPFAKELLTAILYVKRKPSLELRMRQGNPYSRPLFLEELPVVRGFRDCQGPGLLKKHSAVV